MFFAALLIVAKIWKETSSFVNGWLNKAEVLQGLPW